MVIQTIKRNRFFLIFIVFLTIYFVQEIHYAHARGKMFWTESSWNWQTNEGKIKRANLNGTGVEDLVTGLYKPIDIELDLQNHKMYWIDSTAKLIQRANLDGTNVEDILIGKRITSLAIDVESEKLYWGNEILEIIQREFGKRFKILEKVLSP